MTAYDDWLADPSPVSFAEWRRLRCVPVGLLAPQPVRVQRAEREAKVRAPRVRSADGRPHGTAYGWRLHKQYGDTVCDACGEAKRAADRKWRTARKKTGPRELRPCGTTAAARRHRARGEKVCDACRKAESAAARNPTKRKSQRDWVREKREAA